MHDRESAMLGGFRGEGDLCASGFRRTMHSDDQLRHEGRRSAVSEPGDASDGMPVRNLRPGLPERGVQAQHYLFQFLRRGPALRRTADDPGFLQLPFPADRRAPYSFAARDNHGGIFRPSGERQLCGEPRSLVLRLGAVHIVEVSLRNLQEAQRPDGKFLDQPLHGARHPEDAQGQVTIHRADFRPPKLLLARIFHPLRKKIPRQSPKRIQGVVIPVECGSL